MTHLSVITGGMHDLLGRVRTAWPNVVGTAVAAFARPISEDRGVVTISCDNPIDAAELDITGDALEKRLSAVVGADVSLRFEAPR